MTVSLRSLGILRSLVILRFLFILGVTQSPWAFISHPERQRRISCLHPGVFDAEILPCVRMTNERASTIKALGMTNERAGTIKAVRDERTREHDQGARGDSKAQGFFRFGQEDS